MHLPLFDFAKDWIDFGHCLAPEDVFTNSASPVSIGRVAFITADAGFLRSIIAVATVWMVRLPPAAVWQRATELK
jgi:hypothetical protein